MKEINKNIAANIQNYLSIMQMDPQELARKLGCSQSTVYMWIQGNSTPRMDKIDRMCEIFGCEREDLISERLATKEEAQQKQIVITFERKFRELSPETQLRLLAYMEQLKKMEEEKK